MATYDPNAKYWVVYQYSEDKCPHIYTTNNLQEYLIFTPPATILAKSGH